MKYKISTYVLSILLMITIIYACDKPASSNGAANLAANAEDAPPEKCDCYNKVSKELIAQVQKESGKLTRQTGSFIDTATAKDGLDLYKSMFKMKCKDDTAKKIDVYGFAFGIEKFLAFSDLLREWDGLEGEQNLKGVRVYMALKQKTVNNNVETYHDVFMVPIGKDGNNVYFDLDNCTKPPKGKDDPADGGILNTSMLCPNRCE